MTDSRDTRRFYAPAVATLADGQPDAEMIVPLPEEEARHATQVLRLRTGDAMELFDGTGKVARGRLKSACKRAVDVQVEQVRQRNRPGAVVTVAFAVPKGKRLDWLLEKCTELGAAVLQPVRFERSVAGEGEFSESKRRRWAIHCVQACKQSGGDFLPDIRAPLPLGEYLVAEDTTRRLLGDPEGQAIASVAGPHDSAAVLIGPEGGLSDPERRSAIDAGFRPVRLGHTVLRVETAAVAMLAALRALEAPQPPGEPS
ncbi:MAG: RsmE family RNA methyltransferase [Phycisphaerae bacterium]